MQVPDVDQCKFVDTPRWGPHSQVPAHSGATEQEVSLITALIKVRRVTASVTRLRSSASYFAEIGYELDAQGKSRDVTARLSPT